MQMQLFTPVNSVKDADEANEKKHRTAFTSRLSFMQLNESGQRVTEAAMVIELLNKYPPLSSRQISSYLQVERTNICRSLRDLQDQGKVKIAYLGRCEKTGKTVQYYTAAY